MEKPSKADRLNYLLLKNEKTGDFSTTQHPSFGAVIQSCTFNLSINFPTVVFVRVDVAVDSDTVLSSLSIFTTENRSVSGASAVV